MNPKIVAGLALLGACTGENTAQQGSLGVTEVQTQRTASSLVVSGLDEHGATVGEVDVRIGPFTLQEDSRAVVGRQLDVTVLGQTIHHESEGNLVLRLPLDQQPSDIVAFLMDPRVSSVLAPSGITFVAPKAGTHGAGAAPPPMQSDVAYGGCNYAPGTMCSNLASMACQQTYDYDSCSLEETQYGCCASGMFAIARFCGGTNCGPVGPNGCAVCWTASYSNSCSTGYSGTTDIYCAGGVHDITDGAYVYYN